MHCCFWAPWDLLAKKLICMNINPYPFTDCVVTPVLYVWTIVAFTHIGASEQRLVVLSMVGGGGGGGGQGEGVAYVGRGDMEGGHLRRQRGVVELHRRQPRWRGQRRHVPGREEKDNSRLLRSLNRILKWVILKVCVGHTHFQYHPCLHAG